ncbi:HTTM domain-containing protein [Larkinella terrae]|uniref:HTTM domain-containing protein n=1 Tax=Larkinella terrae TaxID=2025311 RepID=A0A7K0EIC1_9BACT|nr:HTTM domain-containing protein [Larkinella terrae]MRS61505.1 HTTM domain-containing protein [Larkinella terrae]
MGRYWRTYTSAAPLAVFRIAFGVMILGSIVRFWAKGWIDELYIKPTFFFPYYGFEFVKPVGDYTYLLFAVCGLSALLVALGWFYRLASVLLFLSFTYIELMDKSTYLNHYYFVSLVAFLLIFLPANGYFSVDAYRNRSGFYEQIPRWTIDSLRLLMGIVYLYAGLAKLNSDWLLEALPLRIWLPGRNDLPGIGFLFNYRETAFAFSWLGALYDLSIPFLLLNRFTRPFAYAAVVVFHVLTAVLFPIGMFPYIMIVAALVFFPAGFHQRLLALLGGLLRLPATALRLAPHPLKGAERIGVSKPPSGGGGLYSTEQATNSGIPLVKTLIYSPAQSRFLLSLFIIFFIIQIIVPFRYTLYPNELFWSEEGYRFSWRVMLMEKMGNVQFKVVDETGQQMMVNNEDHLTKLQEKMMATQPDMLVQFAHHLRDYYTQHGFRNPKVFADTYVSLNGRLGKPYIDPTVNLAQETDSFRPKKWILPFGDEIKGL